jgi:hypothetical protein
MIGLELAGPATVHRELVTTGCSMFFAMHEGRLNRLNPTTSEPAALAVMRWTAPSEAS